MRSVLASVSAVILLGVLPSGSATRAEQERTPGVTASSAEQAARLVEAMRGESMQMRGHSKAPPDRLRERIRRSLRPLRDDAVVALARALSDDDPAMRLNAARMLWQLGSPHGIDDLDPIDITAARDALVAVLRDDDRDVRAAAAIALGAMQRDAMPAVPALIDALQDEWDGVRGQACHALRSIGPQAASAPLVLDALARDPVAHVRQCADVALAAVTAGPAAAPTCAHLPVTTSADVLPPIPLGPAPDWYHDVPQTVLEPRQLALPVSFRVGTDGMVTSACIEAALAPAMAASVRKGLLSQRFHPATTRGGPVAVLVRHTLALDRRDGNDLPRHKLDDIRWLERAVEGQQADVARQNRLPLSERDSPGLRRAAYARLGEIGSGDSLRSLARLEGRHLSDLTGSPADDPLRLALFAQFTLAERSEALSIELGHDEVPVAGYTGVVHYGVDRQAAQDAGVSGGPYVSWRTSRPDDQTAVVTIRELRLRGRTPAGTTDLVFLRQAAGRWVVVGYRRTWIN